MNDAINNRECLGVDLTEPLADVRLMQKMLALSGGDILAVLPETALQVLGVVDSLSDCSRLTSYLVQLLRHPSAQVRSKAALTLGRANLNLNRVQAFLEESDDRVRANAVESLWGHTSEKVQRILWEATRDPSGRVAVNALLGLCKAGDRKAFARLEALAVSPEPVLRAGAAWAMGETADLEFAATLARLEHDEDEKVRAITVKSLRKLERPPAADEPTK
jgi:HEAT repeat protein